MFRLKCQSCAAYTETRDLEGTTCLGCGRVLVEKEPVVAAASQPKKIPFTPGWRFVATVTTHPHLRRVLVTSRPAKFWPFQLAAPMPQDQLPLNNPLSFEVVQRDGDSLLVRAIPPPPSSGKSRDPGPVPVIDPGRLSTVTTLNFPPVGESSLEVMAAADGVKAVKRVEHLAFRKDDSGAWWELAHGHRSRSIRAPVEVALLQVGIERIDRMLRQNHVEWDVDLMVFVDDEMKKIRAHRPGSRETLPGDRQGWDKPWWADD